MRTRSTTAFSLVICLTLACAAPAAAGGYNTPTAGNSPHGNYADTTSKCKVCHAAHNADSSDALLGGRAEVLLRSRRGNKDASPAETPDSGHPCVYCHIVGSWAIKKVYGSVLASYTVDSRYNHDDNHRYFAMGQKNYAGCYSCHSVHGANVLAGYEAKIVRNDPNPSYNAVAVTSLTNFCRDCHEDTGTASGAWRGSRCGACHFDNGTGAPFTRGGTDGANWTDNLPPFYTQARDGVTHVMTTTLTNPDGKQVAWSASADCRDCHAGGDGTAGNSFPHFTSGAYFLDDDYRPPDGAPGSQPDTGMDRVCLNCHVEGGNGATYTTGVGRTF